MSSWFAYSLAAFFFMGLQGFLYKVAAERRCDTARTTFIFMTTVAILSYIFWAYLKEPIGNLTALIILAIVNSLTFLTATMSFIEALKSVPATTAYSVARLNLVILTMFSFVWFHDRLSVWQICGIAVALAAMLILPGEPGRGSTGTLKKGFSFLIISLFASVIAAISSKYAAMYVGKLSFLAFVYSIAALSSASLFKRSSINMPQRYKVAPTIIIGIAMGIQFCRLLCFSLHCQRPSCSRCIHNRDAFCYIRNSLVLIYREKLTFSRIIGFLLTIASLILLRFSLYIP